MKVVMNQKTKAFFIGGLGSNFYHAKDFIEELDEKQREFVTEYYFDDVYDYRSLAKKHFTNRNVIMNACNLACEILLIKLGEKF